MEPPNGAAALVVPVAMPSLTRDSFNAQSLGRGLNAHVKQVRTSSGNASMPSPTSPAQASTCAPRRRNWTSPTFGLNSVSEASLELPPPNHKNHTTFPRPSQLYPGFGSWLGADPSFAGPRAHGWSWRNRVRASQESRPNRLRRNSHRRP